MWTGFFFTGFLLCLDLFEDWNPLLKVLFLLHGDGDVYYASSYEGTQKLLTLLPISSCSQASYAARMAAVMSPSLCEQPSAVLAQKLCFWKVAYFPLTSWFWSHHVSLSWVFLHTWPWFDDIINAFYWIELLTSVRDYSFIWLTQSLLNFKVCYCAL